MEAKTKNVLIYENIELYKEMSFKWTNYEHAYSKVYAHKSCKGLFCKDGFMMSQTEKPHCAYEVLAFDDTNSDTQSVQSAKYYHKNQV